MDLGTIIPGKILFFSLVAAWLLALAPGFASAQDQGVRLSSLDLSKVSQGWGDPHADLSVDGNPLRIGGRKFDHGLGTHAPGLVYIDLDGGCARFTAFVGVDDEVKGSPGSAVFRVLGDGRELFKSPVMRAGTPAAKVDVDLSGVKTLQLIVDATKDGDSYDHADWAEAVFFVTGNPPRTIDIPGEEKVILTPPPPPEPRINGPAVFGVRPGSPFLYTIPATGERPIRFGAEGLPAGLSLDPGTGRITGSLTKPGEHTVVLTAENALGQARKSFRIIVGERIALTPPLGWNSWNCWAGAVDADKVLRAARAMVSSGLKDHGWTYINIDDTWQAVRGGPFKAIQGNEKFPDMKGLCDAVHAMGLKIGIYSTPWITSYAKFPGGSCDNEEGTWTRKKGRVDWRHGKFSFAENDAKQWAAWGMDYLKYDWNPNDVPHVKEMARALRRSGRDMVYSLSNSAPYEYAADWARLANCWRTTGDIRDTWQSVSSIGFSQVKWVPFAGPGHWNDPDMLVVGDVGWGPKLHPSRLTPNEQYTHISLWCLLSAPLLLGCDLEKLDDFTLGLLTNDEVLAVNQDPLGQEALRVAKRGPFEVFARDLYDGSKAVGLFNLGEVEGPFTLKWSYLGIEEGRTVRDLWRQKDLGVFEGSFETAVPRHGVVLLKIAPAPRSP